jgi:hypothetical protein
MTKKGEEGDKEGGGGKREESGLGEINYERKEGERGEKGGEKRDGIRVWGGG